MAAAPLPIQLANTDHPPDEPTTETDADRLLSWLAGAAAEVAIEAGSTALAEALPAVGRLRAATITLLAAAVDDTEPDAFALATLNELGALPVRLRLGADGPNGFRLDETAEGAPAELVVAALARRAMRYLADAEATRVLARCRAPGCGLFFVRAPRSRRWCSDGCGNRARVARHYQRHRP